MATASERRKRNNKDPSGTRSAGKGASTRVLSVFSSEYIYRREKESGVSSETENKMVEIDRGDPFDCGGLSDWYVAEHEEDDGEYQRCGKERGEKDRHYL